MYSPHPSSGDSSFRRKPERQDRILRTAVLKVGDAVVSGKPRRNRIIVKNSATGGHLGVSRAERSIIEGFGSGATAPAVLARLIMKGQSPPLTEFYELVLKAVECGVLVENSGESPRKRRPVHYRFALPLWAAVLLVAGAFGFSVYALATGEFGASRVVGVVLSERFSTDFVLPRSGYDYLIGYVGVSLALGLGNLLTAGLLRAVDAEVYDAGWRWKSPVPHFGFYLLDVRTVGGQAEAAAGLLRMAPLFAFFGIAALHAPHLVFVVLLGILWQTLPLRGYPVAQVFNGLTGRIPPDTHRDLVFEKSRRTLRRLRRRMVFENKKYLALIAAWWLVWTGAAVGLVFLVFPGLLADEFPAPLSAGFLGPALALAAVLPAALAARALLQNVRAALRHSRRRRTTLRKRQAELAPYAYSNPPPEEKILEMLTESIVFGEIKLEDREAIAGKLKPHFIAAKETIVSEDAVRDRMFLVFKGRLEVMRELTSGRLLRLATLGHGDVFGTIPLWDEPPRPRIIRSLTPGILFSLSQKDFSNIVISPDSHDAIKNAVKASFLARIPFFREWPRETIRSFARTGSFVACQAGKYVVRQSRENPFFYIVYDGVSELFVNGRGKSRLRIGEFFGEVGIMRNVASDADVYAREDSRFLVFGRNDFVSFVCQHPEAALAFEKICTKRLGKPVFPVFTGE